MTEIKMMIEPDEAIEMETEEVIQNGGGGGTLDYNMLQHLPQVNGVTLKGNKSLQELGITEAIRTEVDSYVQSHKAELKGDPGTPGHDGDDGFSPVASVSQTMGGAVVTITDKNGTTSATIANGLDGFAPSASVTRAVDGAVITITDKDGTTSAKVFDGQGGSADLTRYTKKTNIKSVNHRGYNTIAPENTLQAYVLSAQNGFKYVETDVSFTSDEVAVLLHDDTIDRTSNGSGAIRSMTYADVLQYDFGSWKSSAYADTKIPTLEEFLKCCKALGLHPYIEIKQNGTTSTECGQIVSIVNRCGMRGNVTYISFSNGLLGHIKYYDANARLGYVVNSITSQIITNANALKTDNNEVFIDAKSGRSDSEIEMCINANLPLEVWTVDSESEITNGYISGYTSNILIAEDVLFNNYEIPVPVPPTPTEKTLTSISATKSVTNYNVGDVVSYNDITVTANYSDGTSADVSTSAVVGTVDTSTIGEKFLPVSYTENGVTKTSEITITVSEVPVSDWVLKYEFTGNDFTICQNAINSPYLDTSKTTRLSYLDVDTLVFNPNKQYKFEYVATESMSIGVQIFAQTNIDKIRNNQTINKVNGFYDGGWQKSGYIIDRSIVGFDFLSALITFKRDSGSNFNNKNYLTSLKIYEK